jgi:hypothetical protein
MKKISILSGWAARGLRHASAVCMMLVFGVLCHQSWAADNIWTRGAGSLNWNVDGNWNQFGVPQAAPFEEEGVIENGDTVFLSSVPVDPAGIILGRTASTFGGLEIRSGGSINVIDSTGTPNGTVSVGVDGMGSLEIQSGGSMSAQFLNVNGQSSLTVGGVGSPASLQVAGGVNLGGTTRVSGAGHTVSGQTVSFGGGGTLIADLRTASHSPVRASSTATLGGNFVLELGGGFTPTLGSSWNIVDAASIVGQFANIDLSAAPATGPGEVIRLATVPGGMHGQLLQLQYTSVLTLSVNWDNKSVSMSSPSGQAINIDGYSILSASGGLESATWNSLQDQAVSGWQEATPSSMALNELNTNVGGSLSVNATPRALGTPFDPVIGTFGQSPEDLVFEYTTSTGQIVQGLVNYTGNRIVNNLLLTVDPSTGAAQLKNSSATTLQIDGYSVLSASGSLLPANGNWLSLQDQGTNGWEESNPTPEILSELLTDGFLTLNPGQFVNLGNLFDEISGTTDLALEFTLPSAPDGLTGAVIYGALQTAVAGDYNGNGVVDAADYTVWRDTLGSITDLRANGDDTGASADKIDAADYAFWKSHFGNTSGSGAGLANVAAVPEPAAWLLLGMACLLVNIPRSNRPEQGV